MLVVVQEGTKDMQREASLLNFVSRQITRRFQAASWQVADAAFGSLTILRHAV